MSVSREKIQKLAELARLEFSEDELAELENSLNELVDYMHQLTELNLDQINPMTSVSNTLHTMRHDEVRKGLSKTQTFQNAPAVNKDHFSVPKTVK